MPPTGSPVRQDSVFLTVAEKGPSATPKVEVASGGIRDAAGNANSTALTVKAARDGLDAQVNRRSQRR